MARTNELSAVLRRELEAYSKDIRMVGVGTVMEVGDGICRVYGLQDAMAGELIEFPDARDDQGNPVRGIVLNLETDSVGVVLMGSDRLIEEGTECRTTGEIFSVPVGRGLLGRVVSPLGDPRDGKGPLPESELAGRGQGAGRHRPRAGHRAAEDRDQGHRHDDSDRPRPARAGHRRPPDG